MNMPAVKERADQALAEAEKYARPEPVSETAAILSMIERVASNKDVDFDRFERLIAMRKDMAAAEAKKAFTTAFAIMQPKLPVIDQNGTILIHHKDDAAKPLAERRVIQSTPFAKWEDINETITPILGAHGFTLSFTADRDGDRVIVNAFLEHIEGHTKTTCMPLALDTTGSKNNVQAVGSSLSYGQRYSARLLLNFTSRAKVDRDDDAQAASVEPDLITDEQVKTLREAIKFFERNEAMFCKAMKVATLANIAASRFDAAKQAIEKGVAPR